MREHEIRRAVISSVRSAHPDEAETLIVEEMGVCFGSARIDVVVVNGLISGFEIKSASDTLTRLPSQVAAYGRVLDNATLVCAARHHVKAEGLLPPWWGIVVADRGVLEWLRPSDDNPDVDIVAVLQLLWRAELLALARSLQVRGASRLTRAQLIDVVFAMMPSNEVRSVVRHALKTREGWRSRPSRQ